MSFEAERRESVCSTCVEGCESPITARGRGKCPIGLWTPGFDRYDLRDIETTVYSCGAKWKSRWPRVEAIMKECGIRRWSFFDAQPGTPYWAPIRIEYVELLRTHEPPYLILEDDIVVVDWRPVVEAPAGAEIVYLGAGGCWRNPCFVNDALRRFEDAYRAGAIACRDIGLRDWKQVFSMFGTHAVLWVDKKVMLEAADLIERGTRQVDVELGASQWRWLAVAPTIPWFAQNDGHNLRGTKEYSLEPGDFVHVMKIVGDRAYRLRQRRRASLAR